MNWVITLQLVGGLAALIIGAELLVRGASRLAAAVGISPLVIGLTVVAFGTSSPELAVSVQSAFVGSADIGIGNVVGSNIFNILLILGISALITPLIVHHQLVHLDVPIMILLSILLWLLALDGRISTLDGILLFAMLIAYVWYGIHNSKKETLEIQQEYEQEFGVQVKEKTPVLVNLLLIGAGLGLLVVGSNWLVAGAVSLARFFNISDLVIGLTIVALGTSMPEVATSVMAAIKKERDIAVGNVVGSNIFNILAVLGLSATVAPGGLAVSQTALQFDIPVMVAVALVTLPILFTGYEISRWEGGVFVLFLAAYITYLFFDAAQQETNRQMLVSAVVWFAIPLTAIFITVTTVKEIRARRTV
jgi:cation:H+ antiporter